MDIVDYRQELEKCRARLAAEMGLQDVPDEVWGYLMKLDLASDVIFGGDDEWRELLKTARDRHKESLEERGIVIPSGREEGEGARSVRYEEIALEPSEGAMKRAEAYSEVAKNMAHAHPDVRRFRRDYLLTDVRRFRRIPVRVTLLTDDEARAFYEKWGGPLSKHPVMKRLFRLAERLSKIYRWREGDAAWFVLTGYTPRVRPLEVSGYIRNVPKGTGKPRTLIPGSSPPRYIAEVPAPRTYHLSTARITITAEAWVDPGEVERVFREVRRQMLGGDAMGERSARTLEVVKFVARRMRQYPGERWEERLRAWNEEHPEWRYEDFRGLRQAFERFAYREYHEPNLQPREKTPHDAYYEDWAEGYPGEG